MQTRNITIDIMRGITITLMVIGHLIPYASYSFNLVYSFHMPIFFLLSGFCSAKSLLQTERLHFGKFLWKKIKAIYIPLLMFRFLLNLMLGEAAGMFQNPLWFFYYPGDWFLQTLFWGDLLFFLFICLCRRFQKSAVRIVLPMAWIAISTYLLDLSRTLNPIIGGYLPFHFGILALCFAFMLIGYFLSLFGPKLCSLWYVRKELAGKETLRVPLAGWIVLACFAAVGLIYLGENEIVNVATTYIGNNYFMFFAFCLLLIYLVYELSRFLASFPHIGRFLAFWGRNSFYVYIVHTFIHFGMNLLLERLTGTLYTPMIDLPWYYCILYFVLDYALIIPYILLYTKCKKKIKAWRRTPKTA